MARSLSARWLSSIVPQARRDGAWNCPICVVVTRTCHKSTPMCMGNGLFQREARRGIVEGDRDVTGRRTSRGTRSALIRRKWPSGSAPVDLVDVRDRKNGTARAQLGKLTSKRASSSLMYSLRTPRDLPMDARNMIASSSMRKGVSSNENANDITVHNDAILLTAASSEYRAVFRPRLSSWKRGTRSTAV